MEKGTVYGDMQHKLDDTSKVKEKHCILRNNLQA